MKNYGLQKLLAVTPLLFCGWLGLHARAHRDSFEFATGTGEQDRAVLAYIPYVRNECEIFSARNKGIDRERVLDLGRRWGHAASIDELKALQPVSFEDSCLIGVRSSVFRAKSQLVSYLMQDAECQGRAGRYQSAAQEIILALGIMESLKYGDFESITDAVAEERRACSFLVRSISHFNSTTREYLRRELCRTSDQHDAKLGAMNRAANIRFYNYKRRSGCLIGISEVRQIAMIARRLRTDGKSGKTLGLVRQNYVDADDQTTLQYFLDLRRANQEDQELRRSTSKLEAFVSYNREGNSFD